MDFDIISKLVPNILTMLTQLASTFVIYLIYRKYVHERVLEYLDSKREFLAQAITDAEAIKLEKQAFDQEQQIAYNNLYIEIANLKEKLSEEAQKQQIEMSQQAYADMLEQRKQFDLKLEAERELMHKEVSAELFDLALLINQKVLEKTDYDQQSNLKALEVEIAKHAKNH